MTFGQKSGAFYAKLKNDLPFYSITPQLTLFSLVTILFRNIPDDFFLQSASVKMVLYVAILGLISIATLPQLKMELRAPSIILVSLFGLQYILTLDSSFLLRGSSERTEMYQDQFYWFLLILIAISLTAYTRLLPNKSKRRSSFKD